MKSNYRTKHNMYGTRPYRIYYGMKTRCENKKSPDYKYYGSKGIKIEWKKFEDFWKDMEKDYSENKTIDRIDNNKNYSKENCRWVSNLENQSNKTNNIYIEYLGEKKHLAEWIRVLNLSSAAVRARIHKGMTPLKAIKNKYKKYDKVIQ